MNNGVKTKKPAHLSLTKQGSTPGILKACLALMLHAQPLITTFQAPVHVTRFGLQEMKPACPKVRMLRQEAIVVKQELEVVMMSNQFLNTLMAAAILKTAQVVH